MFFLRYSYVFQGVPYLNEFSSSENGLITMRLDCDEDIESERNIFKIYKNRQRVE